LQNGSLEWNGYSYGIVILLFGKGIFLGIVIPIGITNPLHTRIAIPLKNERNSHSGKKGQLLPKKPIFFKKFILTLKFVYY
jgi:hypothetical protein